VTERFIRFALVGGIATATQYAILVVLVETIRVNAVFASAIGFLVSSVLNYRLNYSFTFGSDLPHTTAFPKFFFTALMGLLINTGTMFLLIDLLGVHYLLSQVAATGLTLVWNFSINSLWSFRDQ